MTKINFSAFVFFQQIKAGKVLFFSFLLLGFLNIFFPKAYAAQQSLPAELIYALSRETIQADLDYTDGSFYELEALTRLPAQLTIPQGDVSLEPTMVGKLRYNAPIQVRVVVKVNGFQQMSIATTWRVKKFKAVLVAARDLLSRTKLTEEDFFFEEREIVRIDDVIFDSQDIVGLETKRAILAGTLISRAMLDKPTLIRSGDNVTIISTAGSIVVQTAGQALQAGAVGDVIRVKNLSSGRAILARIENENTVVITNAAR